MVVYFASRRISTQLLDKLFAMGTNDKMQLACETYIVVKVSLRKPFCYLQALHILKGTFLKFVLCALYKYIQVYHYNSVNDKLQESNIAYLT